MIRQLRRDASEARRERIAARLGRRSLTVNSSQKFLDRICGRVEHDISSAVTSPFQTSRKASAFPSSHDSRVMPGNANGLTSETCRLPIVPELLLCFGDTASELQGKT